MTGKRILIFAIAIYLVMVVFSVSCLVTRRDGLQFHTRDYNYFIEQAARLTDPQLSKRFTLNVEGYNMFGLQGIEGAVSLIQAIHTEYFRYTYAMLYGIFHSTLPLYIFFSLVFFLPIPYFALISRARASDDPKKVLFFILLFVLFPATLPSATADLRPRMLFIAAWCLLILAIYYDRSFVEKLVAFGFLIGIREEGIFLGGMALVIHFLYMRGKPNRWKQTLVFLALDFLAMGLFFAFMAWGKYLRVDAEYDPRVFLGRLFSEQAGLVLVSGGLVALALGWVWLKHRRYFIPTLTLLVYCGAICVTGYQAVSHSLKIFATASAQKAVGPWDLYLQMATSYTTSLVYYITFLLLILLLDYFKGKGRAILTGVLIGLGVVFVLTTMITFPQKFANWREAVPQAQLVWDFVDSHDRYDTHILLDYSTYQAFYNFENVLVYNRLPMWLVLPEDRYYPENQDILVKQIQQRMEYAVVSTDSLETVKGLARQAGVPVRLVEANEWYAVLKFRE